MMMHVPRRSYEAASGRSQTCSWFVWQHDTRQARGHMRLRQDKRVCTSDAHSRRSLRQTRGCMWLNQDKRVYTCVAHSCRSLRQTRGRLWLNQG